MASASSATLPIHRGDLGRQVRFDNADHRSFWRRVARKIAVASTGAPTDGLGEVSETSTSVPAFLAAQKQASTEKDGGEWFVDEIVVSGEDSQYRPLGSERGTTRPSESGDGSIRRGYSADSHHYTGGAAEWIKWRAWPAILSFFDPSFEDAETEEDFQKQLWYTTKPVCFVASLYLILNWVLYLILNHSVTRYEQIAYYGGLTFFTLPVPFMVASNLARRCPVFFQIWICIAIWYCGVSEVIQIKQCGFYTHNHCHGKDFLAMLYYNTALPAMMIFIVSRRFYNFVAQTIVFGLLLGLVIPDQKIFARNVISFAIFSVFIQGLHYSREMTERRMYLLNSQLKLAYRAQQKSQIAESKASQAKRRFASYIFHEVRVPLNTAMLAYQNLRTSNAFKDEHLQDHNNVEVYALEASLTMMQQVLNDVLDLQKMDAGKFESSPRPFPLHRAINSIMGPIAVATQAKSINLRVDLDPRIDQIQTPSNSSEGLWVIGDEIRLRQVLTNLTSNAVKFTPEGAGEVKVTTKLLTPLPRGKVESSVALVPEEQENPLISATNSRPDMLVVRLEVQDSGPGVRPSDLVDNRLFQPFVQTRVGKMNGSGTGLGLAIVQQIISLSGGRLGIQSRKGEGALFWVEFAYRIATPSDIQAARNMHTLCPSPRVSHIPPPISDLEPEKYAALSANMARDFAFPLALPDLKRNNTSPSLKPRSLPGAVSAPSSSSNFGRTSCDSMRLSLPSVECSPIKPSSDGPLRILVVDDDALTRTLMTRMLTKLGCVVETANDGQECLDILARYAVDDSPYDLISLDNQMPVLTGEETVREMRSVGRTDLVVGCTGNALTEDQASYIEAGADRILTKPIMLKDLKSLLQIAQERRTSSQNGTRHSDESLP
ncbi:hypothetical protein JAAARDRAFT_203396 [Jaapia argillacea MUCL 33604]|uniref:histidine kinase n=1 Tax=Jaapia argillacea MUCL 33604 TaxID=933084 RepID=A0A067Q5D8_9AGAM|nr:hypothetical protein JAAARDRAFT_203396 [Jaapia argillacea MUCL 33604]